MSYFFVNDNVIVIYLCLSIQIWDVEKDVEKWKKSRDLLWEGMWKSGWLYKRKERFGRNRVILSYPRWKCWVERGDDKYKRGFLRVVRLETWVGFELEVVILRQIFMNYFLNF